MFGLRVACICNQKNVFFCIDYSHASWTRTQPVDFLRLERKQQTQATLTKLEFQGLNQTKSRHVTSRGLHPGILGEGSNQTSPESRQNPSHRTRGKPESVVGQRGHILTTRGQQPGTKARLVGGIGEREWELERGSLKISCLFHGIGSYDGKRNGC